MKYITTCQKCKNTILASSDPNNAGDVIICKCGNRMFANLENQLYEVGDIVCHKFTGDEFVVTGKTLFSDRIKARGKDYQEHAFTKREIEFVREIH